MPSHCHMTAPRQYMGPVGRVVLPGNSARKAMSEEFASVAILPGESRSENPVLAERIARSSNRNPGLTRGNKRNKRTTSGAALARSFEAEPSGGQKAPGGDPRWNWIN